MSNDDSSIRATLRKPFAAQVAAFRLRLGDLVPTERYDDIVRSAHDRSFMVAGAMKADLLADLGSAVDRAIVEGTGIEAFRADFRQIVERHGWHGWTGEGTAKGEAWRTKVIYRTNMATSMAAGRWAQLVDGKFKYLVYVHSGAAHPRLEHLAWDGLILPFDHEFWATHYPPNGWGWGCGCLVRGARTLAGAKRVGGKTGVKLPPNWNAPDPKTGLPRGIGKGWDYAPGASVASMVLALRGKLDLLPERPAVDLIQSWLQASIFENWLKSPVGNWPLVRITAKDAKAIGSKKTVADISAQSAQKQMAKHPELTPLDYAQAQITVSQASNKIQDGVNSMIYVREIFEGGGYVLVVKTTKTGKGLFVTSFRRLSRDQARRDRTIAQLLRKR